MVKSATIEALINEAGLGARDVYEICIDPLTITFKFYNRNEQGNLYIENDEVSKSLIVHDLSWREVTDRVV